MNTHVSRTPYIPQAVMTAQGQAQQRRLLAYITSCLPPADWRHAADLAEQVWQTALERGGMDITLTQPGSTDPESGLPGWLASAARTVLRRHLHPIPASSPQPVRVHRFSLQLQEWELELLAHGLTDTPAAA